MMPKIETNLAPGKGVGMRFGTRNRLIAAPKKRPHRLHDTVEV